MGQTEDGNVAWSRHLGAKQAISMAVVLIVGFTVNFYVAAVLTFVMVSVGGIWYHLRWRDAVDQMVAA